MAAMSSNECHSDSVDSFLGLRTMGDTVTKAQKICWKADKHFHVFIESAPDAIVITDAQGRIVLINRLTEQMFGYPRNELMGQPVELLMPERYRDVHVRHREGYARNPKTRPAGAGQPLSGRRKDGSEFPIEINLSSLETEEGILVTSIIRDITARRQAERKIQQINRQLCLRVTQLEAANRELEAFSYSASHDLRAPLRAISSYVHMVREDYGGRLDAEGNRLLEVVSGESERMGVLIDDLLAFSRLARQQMQIRPIDMTALAQEVCESLIRATPETSPCFEVQPLPTGWGDAPMLRQVFVNLIGNAIKFARRRPTPRIEITGWSNDTELTYCVKDNGVGFEEKCSHKLFRAFQRLHSEEEFEGTGVGLALVHRVIQRHGGRVWAEGKLDAGAAFYFTLPRRKKQLMRNGTEVLLAEDTARTASRGESRSRHTGRQRDQTLAPALGHTINEIDPAAGLESSPE